MAKVSKLAFTQKDLMIWTMVKSNGTKTYYVLEKEPFAKEGVKKAIHKMGLTGDAVFRYRDQAAAEIAKWPAPPEGEPEAIEALATSPAPETTTPEA
jgi:hypothetical protein